MPFRAVPYHFQTPAAYKMCIRDRFRSAAGKRKSRIYILIRAGIVSFAYTVQIFLVNNFWRYLCFNSFFGWERKVDYLYFTVKDITYAVGWGKYRYPFTLAAMFSICIAAVSYTHLDVYKRQVHLCTVWWLVTRQEKKGLTHIKALKWCWQKPTPGGSPRARCV